LSLQPGEGRHLDVNVSFALPQTSGPPMLTPPEGWPAKLVVVGPDGEVMQDEELPLLGSRYTWSWSGDVGGTQEGTFKVTVIVDFSDYQGEVAATSEVAIPAAPETLHENALRGTLHELRNAIGLFQAHTGCYPLQLPDLMRPANDPPKQGVLPDGETVADIGPDDWAGPYLQTPDGKLPLDPISGKADWAYVNEGEDVGSVHSSAPGKGQDGTEYTTW